MNQKAIFFDIDGTIYEAGKPAVSEAVLHAVDFTQKRGHLCFIASGRPLGSIPKEVKQAGFDGYICGNGSLIYLKDELFAKKCIDPARSQPIIDLFEKLQLQYIILTPQKSSISAQHDLLFAYYANMNIDLSSMEVSDDLSSVLENALKIEVMTTSPHQIQAIQELADSLDFFVEVRPNGYLELCDKQVTKGTAILEILKHFHLPVEDSIVLGDGPNDIDMFQTAGYRIAMGNAVDEIKALADEVTLSVSEDGAAHALYRLFGTSEN